MAKYFRGYFFCRTLYIMEWATVLRHWRSCCTFRRVRSPFTSCINFSFVHLQYITSQVRQFWWSLVIDRYNYSSLVFISFGTRSPSSLCRSPRNFATWSQLITSNSSRVLRKSPVNFGPLTTENGMLVWTHPNWIIRETIFRPWGDAGPSNFNTHYRLTKVC